VFYYYRLVVFFVLFVHFIFLLCVCFPSRDHERFMAGISCTVGGWKGIAGVRA